MKPYSQYSPVFLGWVDKIPMHWKTARLKRLLFERKENNNPVKAREILSLTNTRGVIPYAEKGNVGNKSKERLEDYHLAYPGDLILNSMNVIIGSVGVSKYFGAISPVYYALATRGELNIKYSEYIFRLSTFEKTLEGLGNGILDIRKRIPMIKLNNVILPVPPRPEQDQIVRFLDWKVSSINKLIGVKQRQISTLKELMQAEIEKQLRVYPVVDTVRLKQLGTFFKGGGFSRDNLVEGGGYPAILYGDIYTQYEYKTSVITHSIDSNAYDVSRKIVKSDIVMAGTGETKDEIGKSILYMGDEVVAAGGDVIVFRPNKGINVEYLLYQFYSQAALKHRYIHGKGDIIVHIYPTALGNTLISLPDEENQVTAVERINEIIDQEKTIATLTEEISVLREYKVRLVADIVTGKIDVRDIKVPDFEYVQETGDSSAEDNKDMGDASENGEK